MPGAMSDHVARNRAFWDVEAARYVAGAERAWSETAVTWGIWHCPETELKLLPAVDGLDVIELGCGTAYISAWLARRGARVTGIDNSPEQLRTAHRMQDEHDLHFPLILGDAEHVPLPDSSFDLAVSEYGAALWCDPYVWIPEAHRLLRAGGRLVFLTNAPLLVLCENDDENVPAGRELRRDYFGMHRVEWPDTEGVEFHLPHGDMIDLLRGTGFSVVRLAELRAPADSTTGYGFLDAAWAHRWPSEEVWVADKLGE